MRKYPNVPKKAKRSNGITEKQNYRIVHSILKKKKSHITQRYNYVDIEYNGE